MDQELSRREYREDRALARKLRAGRPRAWNQFYDLYSAPLFRFALSRVEGRPDTAADVTQDVIVVAMERIGEYSPRRGSLWSWLCGIAVNKSREALRSEMHYSRLRKRMGSQPARESRERNLDTSDACEVLFLLNPRHQEVLSLKYLEGFHVREIAERLGVSEKAVESRLTRARDAYRKAHEQRESWTAEGAAR